MSLIYYKAVRDRLLLKKEAVDLCCLCLTAVDNRATSINDKVFVRCKDIESNEEEIDGEMEILSRVIVETIGEIVIDSMSLYQSVCFDCTKSVIGSYNFIHNTRDNVGNLITAVETISSGLEDLSQELDIFKTLYLSINPQEMTIQQFYDIKKLEFPSKTALPRFHLLANGLEKSDEDCPPRKRNGRTNRRPRDFSTIFIKTHELIHDPSKPKEYKCKICLKIYPTSGNLRQHFFAAHFKKEFQCDECPKSFGTLGLLETHKSCSHRTVDCPECGKKLLNRTSTVKRHLLTHQRARKVCYRCGKVYKKRKDFERHMALACAMPSRTPGNFTCDTCGYHCNFKHQLSVHIKYMHTDVEGHVCQWCGRKCLSASALKTHILKHTKEKNYVCAQCGGKFVTKQSLINHTRLHTGERPYKCHLCEQSFLSASRRKDHIDNFHINDSFSCTLCPARYNAKRSLVKHMKRHYAESVESKAFE